MATVKKMTKQGEKLGDFSKYVTEVIYRLMSDEFELPEAKAKDAQKYNVTLDYSEGKGGGFHFNLDVGKSIRSGLVHGESWSLEDFKKDIKGSLQNFFSEMNQLVGDDYIVENNNLSIYSRLILRDWVGLTNRGLDFIKLTADLDVSKFDWGGKFQNAGKLFEAYGEENMWKFSTKTERDEYFVKCWRTYEIIAPLDIGRNDVKGMYNFFREVIDVVKPKEIEKSFSKLFSNKTGKADIDFNKSLCLKLLDLLGEENISNENIKNFIKENNVTLSENTNLSKPVDFSGYETFSFNEKAFENFKLSSENKGVSIGLDYSIKDELFKTLIDLVTQKKVQDYTGVKKATVFKLPNKVSGYFLEVNENYTASKFERALFEASIMIQEESVKDPVSFTSSIRKFSNKEYAEKFDLRISKLLIGEKINAVVEANREDDVDISRGSSFKL